VVRSNFEFMDINTTYLQLLESYVSPMNVKSTESGYVYHATNLERARNIARSKLATHRPWYGTDQGVWPDSSSGRRSYWNRDASNVWSFAPEEGPHVILRTKYNPKNFRSESGTGDVYSRRPIHPRHLEILHQKQGWVPLRTLR